VEFDPASRKGPKRPLNHKGEAVNITFTDVLVKGKMFEISGETPNACGSTSWARTLALPLTHARCWLCA
jgi:hypothetical protein